MSIVTLIYLFLIAVGFYFGKWLGAIGLVLIYFFFFHQRQLAKKWQNQSSQKTQTSQNQNQPANRSMHVKIDWAYHELGIAQSANAEEIKRARKKLLNHYHPDKLGQATATEKKVAEEKVNQINRAYEAIKQFKGFS